MTNTTYFINSYAGVQFLSKNFYNRRRRRNINKDRK